MWRYDVCDLSNIIVELVIYWRLQYGSDWLKDAHNQPKNTIIDIINVGSKWGEITIMETILKQNSFVCYKNGSG